MASLSTTLKFARHTSLATVFALATSPGNLFATDNTTEALTEFGDIMQFALPIAGLGATYIADDPEGRKQFYKSLLTALGTTTTLKGVYRKLRPRSNSRTSFPSGHTTAAFAGAAFIDQRYGHGWGTLAYTAAAITGYSRVRSENHFTDDVLAGASIAVMSNWLWVTPYDSQVMLAPQLVEGGVGISIRVNEDVGRNKRHVADEGLRPRFRYTLQLGSAELQSNRVTSPAATGTTFDLNNFNKDDDPITSSVGTLEWFISDKDTLVFSLWPFEALDTGQFRQPVNFAGNTFPANTDIRSAWRNYELRAIYRRNFTENSPATAELGAGAMLLFTNVDIATADGSIVSEVSDSVLLPLLHARVGYQLSHKWRLGAEISGISLDTDTVADGAVYAAYAFNRYWEMGAGIGYYDRDIETPELINRARYNSGYISMAYTFY